MKKVIAWMSAGVLAVGCGSSGSGTPDLHGSRGVTMGGPQDIAEFRTIVAGGGVPDPSVLDPVGFFAEHALDLPPADCGATICAHPQLAVAPRFDHTNWTMAFVALNSSVDPSTVVRPPVHAAIVVERTTRTAASWSAIEAGIRAMAAALRPGDLLSVVVYGESATTLVAGVAPTDPSIGTALATLDAHGPATDTTSALYEGIAAGAAAVDGFAGATRLVVVTSGHADAGIASSQRVLDLADAWVRRGVSMSVVGTGDEYDARLPGELGSLGAGTYSFAESDVDMQRIFQSEGETTLVPLATSFRLTVTPAPGYTVGAIYGAERAYYDGTGVVLASPALFLGLRMGAADVGGGRRGGGGGLFVELIPDPTTTIDADAPAFTATTSWTEMDGTATGPLALTVANTLAPGAVPTDMAVVTDPSGARPAGDTKIFMMLNMYFALRAATSFYADGDCARAMGVIDMFARSVALFERYVADPDIDADWMLLQALRANLGTSCMAITPVQPVNAHMSCMYS